MSASASPYAPPRPSTWQFGASAIIATLTHGLLALLLFFGVHWQSQAPAVVEAELWTSVPQVSGPAPLPDPAPVAPTPEPVAPPAPKVEEEAPPPKPDIEVRQEKPVPPKPKVERKTEPKAEPKPEPKPEAKPLVRPEPKSAPKQEKAAKAEHAPSDLDRLMASADGTATAKPSSGTAAVTSGRRGDPGYSDLIIAKIRSNIRYPLPPDLQSNPEAHFQVEQLPDGTVISVRKTRTSGLPAYDDAVERAIQASSPLPRGRDGSVSARLELVFHLRDDH